MLFPRRNNKVFNLTLLGEPLGIDDGAGPCVVLSIGSKVQTLVAPLFIQCHQYHCWSYFLFFFVLVVLWAIVGCLVIIFLLPLFIQRIWHWFPP